MRTQSSVTSEAVAETTKLSSFTAFAKSANVLPVNNSIYNFDVVVGVASLVFICHHNRSPSASIVYADVISHDSPPYLWEETMTEFEPPRLLVDVLLDQYVPPAVF